MCYIVNRIAILSGPGGMAVSAAEACGHAGLRLAELSPDTCSTLAEFVPPTGTSLRNPIDVGLSASLEIDIYIQAARAAIADPGVDALLIIGGAIDAESNERYAASLIDAYKTFGKPFLMSGIPGYDADLARRFCEAGMPFFDSVERAMHTCSLVWRYRRICEERVDSQDR